MTDKTIAKISLAALLASGGASLAAQDAGSPSESEFNPIQRYDIAFDDRRDVAEFYAERYGFKMRDAASREVEHPSDPYMRVMLLTFDGIRDDAVQGVQFRLGLKANAGRWEAAEAGMRRKCYRGDNSGEWTKDVCP